jgi:NADH dehydrogenase/NADH:ubiquinone oxidoreductase subunit G
MGKKMGKDFWKKTNYQGEKKMKKFMEVIAKVRRWIVGDQRDGDERRVKPSKRKKTNKRKTQRRKK